MSLFLATILTAALAGAGAASESPNDDGTEAVVRVLRSYHSALAAGQPQAVLAVLGPSYFMADERTQADAKAISAHLFLTGERLRSSPKNYLDQVGPHRNAFETVSVSIRGGAAVALTRDTGSNGFRKWRNEETAWLLGRVDGEWRIVGMIIRDIQLPQ
jgi:hypothetical protein